MAATARLLLLLLVASAVLAGHGRPADADAYDDIEKRLKTTGIEASLAREVTTTIRKGAAKLIDTQHRNGSWKNRPGETVLAALALVHIGDPKAKQAAERALAWLARDDVARRTMRLRTYECGIMAMLLHALRTNERLLENLRDGLARGAAASGYWGYLAAGESGAANLSTSQFACLGLWAAERAGQPRAEGAWELHGDGLVRAQSDDGSWGYWAGERGVDRGYPTGTFMGLADLVLARPLEIPSKLAGAKDWYALLWAQRASEVAFARHVRWVFASDVALRASIGTFAYYSLYAVEKAAIFLDTRMVGAVDWYVEGAKVLIASQTDDGRFVQMGTGGFPAWKNTAKHKSDTVSAAFALLFLLRASEVYRPITPRGIPEPTPMRPVTGQDGHPEDDVRAEAVDANAPPPLDLATLMLDRLEMKTRSLELRRVAELQSLLAFVARTLPRYTADGRAIDTLHDAWVRRAETLLVPLCLPGRNGEITNEPWRLVLATDALDVLGLATSRGGERLMKALPSKLFERHGQRRVGIGYYGALFRCLRETREPEIAKWLVARCSPDIKERAITIPALLELARVDGLDANTRQLRALTLAVRMKPLEKASAPPQRDLQRDVLLTVGALVGESYGEGFIDPGRSLAGWRKQLRGKR